MSGLTPVAAFGDIRLTSRCCTLQERAAEGRVMKRIVAPISLGALPPGDGVPRRLALLDRDGVLIVNRSPYVASRADVTILPGAVSAVRRLAAAGFTPVVVTNQAGIGRHLLGRDEVVALHEWIVARFAASGAHISHSLICPHAPAALCGCRKPAPGMVRLALERSGARADESVMFGDALTDLCAARAAGVPALLVRTGIATADEATGVVRTAGPGAVHADLAGAVEWVLAHRTTGAGR